MRITWSLELSEASACGAAGLVAPVGDLAAEEGCDPRLLVAAAALAPNSGAAATLLSTSATINNEKNILKLANLHQFSSRSSNNILFMHICDV